MIPRPSFPIARPRAAALLAALLLAACSTGWSEAHDWVSPAPADAAVQRRPVAPPNAPSWPNVVWPGPASGPPAAPSGRDCQRAPQSVDLDSAAVGESHPSSRRERVTRDADSALAATERRSLAPGGAAPAAKSAPTASEASADAAIAAPQRQPAPAPLQPATPPVTSSVTAGVIDDNTDFGAYLAYRQRNAGLPVRARDVTERYLLTVHDAAGRPVNDAEVSLHAEGRTLPLWARTDAGGQVWIHPGVMADGMSLQPVAFSPATSVPRVIEVQVRRGATIGRALLTRGQRDDLQVRLGTRLPTERARLDLAFLVDATGSMADEIDKLKRSMRSMADQIARLPSQPDICFALVAYRDRGDAYFVRATDFGADLGAFQRTLGALQAGGGGDYPEALNEALHTAVHRLSWRGEGATRLVVVVADAPPHLDYGTPTYDDDMQGALARGIKLFAVGASGLDSTGEYVFRQAAQYTGGRFVFLTYAEARDPSSGPGRETTHDVGRYSVESLDKLVVRLVREELAKRPTS